jgi:hypothetical protein
LKNILVSTGNGGIAAIHIANGWNVVLTNVPLRASGTNAAAVALLYDQSATAGTGTTPHQLYMHGCDVAFADGSTTGGVLIEPTVSTSLNINGGEFHHMKFGIKINDTAISSGNLSAVVDSTQFFSFNTNAVVVTGGGTGTVNLSLSRSTVSQTATDGLYVVGTGASALLYEDVITETNIGVALGTGGTVFTFGNNDIFFNGTNVSGGSLTAAPAGVGGSTQ